jgi:hypothetical protein
MTQTAEPHAHRPAGPSHSAPTIALFYVIPLVLALAMVGVGSYMASQGRGWVLLAAGAASVVAVLITWPIATAMGRAQAEALEATRQVLSTLEARLADVNINLNVIAEQQLLSDRARAVAYRDKDRDAVRRAIQEEINRRDFEAAMALANDIESAFGYKQEADRFRQEIELKRNEVVRKQINEAILTVERCCRDEDWEPARTEAERIARLYPADDQARGLPGSIEVKRQAFKRQLLESWRDAVGRKDVDGGIEILKRLDLYLTPSEAAEMQEDARAMFRQKLHGLSNQFGEAVHNNRISDAIRIGEEIMRDYPNTRVAQEIRERMDVLRHRANGTPAVANV